MAEPLNASGLDSQDGDAADNLCVNSGEAPRYLLPLCKNRKHVRNPERNTIQTRYLMSEPPRTSLGTLLRREGYRQSKRMSSDKCIFFSQSRETGDNGSIAWLTSAGQSVMRQLQGR